MAFTDGGGDPEVPEPGGAEPSTIDAMISRRVSKELQYYDGISHRGMFALPKYLRRGLEG